MAYWKNKKKKSTQFKTIDQFTLHDDSDDNAASAADTLRRTHSHGIRFVNERVLAKYI